MCLDLIRSYASSNTGKYRVSGLDLDEEGSCEDLLQFLKMMTHLTIKDYVDFGNSNGQISHEQETPILYALREENIPH